jgi:hypothetical protein
VTKTAARGENAAGRYQRRKSMDLKDMTDNSKTVVDGLFKNALEHFGKKVCDEHPELLVAHVRAGATCFAAMLVADEMSGVAKNLANVAKNVCSDHPLQGETLDGISMALSDIAQAIGKRTYARSKELEERLKKGIDIGLNSKGR